MVAAAALLLLFLGFKATVAFLWFLCGRVAAHYLCGGGG
jgi:hypothetical protein